MSEEIKEIKTVEDLDKKDGKSNEEKTDLKLTVIENDPFKEKYEQLKVDFEAIKTERDTLKGKYTKALEENNRLFNRLTGTPEKQVDSLQSILNIKGGN